MDDSSVTGAVDETVADTTATDNTATGTLVAPANPETVLGRIHTFFSNLAVEIEHDEQALVAWAKAHI